MGGTPTQEEQIVLSPTRARATLAAAGAAVAGLLLSSLSGGVSHAADHESCRPDGLYKTPGVDVPYCSVYDAEGREKMGADHQRRVIGYFTGGVPARTASPPIWPPTSPGTRSPTSTTPSPTSAATTRSRSAATARTTPRPE
ncbi:hypothetical protein [Streptomyces sp. A3M-1-3]|uniref:hypothetical protein n=1 Tax=Streptomyces sp. A3M-1-3 TaxID=2962044 RepID=UPI0035ABC669